MQEVALVLGVVQRLQQFEAAMPALPHARIVAGGDALGAERHRMVEEGLELDLGIAQHVRVRRAAGRIFPQEIGEHAVLVLGGEVDRLDVDADQVGHRDHVEPILARRAVFAVVVVLPVLHEQADHLVALLLQQPGRDRRVHPARHADHDALAAADGGVQFGTGRDRGKRSGVAGCAHGWAPGISVDGCVYSASSAKRLPAR